MSIINFFKKIRTGNPPWDYYFLKNLDEKEYPLYLAKLFYLNTREKLPLKYDFKNRAWVIDKKRCKTFNQKIQWIKLYGVTDLMRKCTDKVAVRDYVAEKIGKEYLKPVLQVIGDCHCERKRSNPADFKINNNNIGWTATDYRPRSDSKVGRLYQAETMFDKIDFDKLPNAFVIKCNHGCKWQFIIKDKEDYLNTKPLVKITKRQMTGWLQQDYSFWGGFEMQYKGIKPKILIEKLMREEINTEPIKINIYYFNGEPYIIYKFYNKQVQTVYDKNFKPIDDIFAGNEKTINKSADYIINQIFDLSNQLVKGLNIELLRTDWMIYENKPYFEEITFTPYSGFLKTTKEFNKQFKRSFYEFRFN